MQIWPSSSVIMTKKQLKQVSIYNL